MKTHIFHIFLKICSTSNKIKTPLSNQIHLSNTIYNNEKIKIKFREITLFASYVLSLNFSATWIINSIRQRHNTNKHTCTHTNYNLFYLDCLHDFLQRSASCRSAFSKWEVRGTITYILCFIWVEERIAGRGLNGPSRKACHTELNCRIPYLLPHQSIPMRRKAGCSIIYLPTT